MTPAQKRRATIERRDAERARLEDVRRRLLDFLVAERAILDYCDGEYGERTWITLDSLDDPTVYIRLEPDDAY